MQINKEDKLLGSLIDLFNEQIDKQEWDAAYCTSTAIAEHFEMRSKSIRENIVNELKVGVINRANCRAIAKKKK
jgi:hypothetical protein